MDLITNEDSYARGRTLTAADAIHPTWPTRRLALRVLLAFTLTFLAARVLVYLIMTRTIPDLYLFVGATHVHHLNYGIFLLSGVGAFLIFRRPSGPALMRTATMYGIGLALTFDEFGMWLHLGGGYWQRASFDAVVVVAAILAVIAVAPSARSFRALHWSMIVILGLALAAFAVLAMRALQSAERAIVPRLQQLEENSAR